MDIEKDNLAINEKYNLTIKEAVKYFNIGEKISEGWCRTIQMQTTYLHRKNKNWSWNTSIANVGWSLCSIQEGSTEQKET